MGSRSKITHMDDWDVFPSQPRLKGGGIPLCDLKHRTVMHRLGSLIYFSQFKRTKEGTSFSEIKQSAGMASLFAKVASDFIENLVGNMEGWCIITTPRRRHSQGFHLATAVCWGISARLRIPFHAEAVQCINRNRLSPEFHLLLPVPERRVIIYDDIITTGMTLTATAALLPDRDSVLNIISINNR